MSCKWAYLQSWMKLNGKALAYHAQGLDVIPQKKNETQTHNQI